MILHCDYGCLGVQRAVIAFDQDAIGEFQWPVNRKQNFARCAELDYGVLEKDVFVFTGVEVASCVAVAISVAIAVAAGAAEFDRDPHRCGFGKELGQAAYDF